MNLDLKMSKRGVGTRFLLLLGFGSLLLLPSIAFYWTRQELARANREMDTVRTSYLKTNKQLNELRTEVVNGGTYLRDFLLEPSENAAESHREALIAARRHAMLILGAKELQQGGEAFLSFVAAYDDYWKTIEPVLGWDAARRKREGLTFLQAEAFLRRTAMLNLVAKIGTWNEDHLARGERELQGLFDALRKSQEQSMILFLLAGLALASFVYWHVTQLEKQSADRLQQAEEAREESKELSARLLAVQEEERKAISRELHDGVAQNLSALRLGMEQMLRRLPSQIQQEIANESKGLGQLTEETLKLTRNLSLLLRPSMLDDLGLVPALRWLARECQKRSGVTVAVEASEEFDELPEVSRICVFRIAQEALSNAVTHSGAKTVMLRASQNEGKLLISIQDDGKSFDVEREKGMGILGMTERVEKLGGKFSIASKPGVGTVVMAELP